MIDTPFCFNNPAMTKRQSSIAFCGKSSVRLPAASRNAQRSTPSVPPRRQSATSSMLVLRSGQGAKIRSERLDLPWEVSPAPSRYSFMSPMRLKRLSLEAAYSSLWNFEPTVPCEDDVREVAPAPGEDAVHEVAPDPGEAAVHGVEPRPPGGWTGN